MPDADTFEFLGRVLGKALFEGITIGPQFARFFLHKLTGRPTHLHHLPSLDPELYKSLMFLKTFEGDVADLSLTFTISADLLGGAVGEEVELVPGGKNIAVTAKNRMAYIHKVQRCVHQSRSDQHLPYIAGG
jgi:ubiquitin-protein ligase E3 C